MYWITMVHGDMALKQLYDAGQDTSWGHPLYTQHKLRLEEEVESLAQVVEVEGELPRQDDEKDLMIG